MLLPSILIVSLPQQLIKLTQSLFIGRLAHFEFIDHVAIKILDESSTCFVKYLLYLLAHFFLQSVKGSVYFLRGATSLVDVKYTMLEVDAIHCTPQYFVAATEYAFEQVIFLVKQLIYALVGSIGFIDEIDHNHIILLPITMTAAYALFYSLWIPWQVEIYQQRTEL